MAHASIRRRGAPPVDSAAGAVLRRLCRALLLLLVLGLQQGAYLHELSHYEPASIQNEEHPQDAGSPCVLCLAYAGAEVWVSPGSLLPSLLIGLSFALTAVATFGACVARAPTLRNRGPPERC